MQVHEDSARVRFPPPFVYMGALPLGLLVDWAIPASSFGYMWRLLVPIGAILVAAGAATVLAAAGLFRKIGTNVEPWRPSTGVVSTGVYRWTRNPMYLGMALIFAGISVALDAPIALASLLVVLIVIRIQVIAREEHYLEAKFGDEYRRYKASVRRWI